MSQSLPGDTLRGEGPEPRPGQGQVAQREDSWEGVRLNILQLDVVRQVHHSQVEVVVEGGHLDLTGRKTLLLMKRKSELYLSREQLVR